MGSMDAYSDNYCDKESGVRKVILRGEVKSIVLAQVGNGLPSVTWLTLVCLAPLGDNSW